MRRSDGSQVCGTVHELSLQITWKRYIRSSIHYLLYLLCHLVDFDPSIKSFATRMRIDINTTDSDIIEAYGKGAADKICKLT